MIFILNDFKRTYDGNSSAQDFALAAKPVPICKCDKESGLLP